MSVATEWSGEGGEKGEVHPRDTAAFITAATTTTTTRARGIFSDGARLRSAAASSAGSLRWRIKDGSRLLSKKERASATTYWWATAAALTSRRTSFPAPHTAFLSPPKPSLR